MAARRSSVYIGQSLFWAILLAACSGGGSQKGVLIGSKKAANSQNKPCQNSGQQKLAGDALNLATDDPMAIEVGKKAFSPVLSIRNGGYINVGFHGFETKMDVFKDKPIPNCGDGEGKERRDCVLGNPNGVVEVLQIPYCLANNSFESSPDTWIRRCLNSRDQGKLTASFKTEFIEVIKRLRAPKQFSKICTAHFSLDYDDVMTGTPKPRVRVLTAEHCYQPSYHDDVILNVFMPEEKVRAHSNVGRGLYARIKFESDGNVWRKKVLAVGGGGGTEGDSKLQEKILILRSMDGRSSDLYRNTVDKYCLGGKDSPFYPKFSDGKAPDTFDCYALTDIGTFKGSIDLAHDIRLSKNGIGGENPAMRSELRRAAFDYLAEESKKNNNTGVDQVFASRFPEFIRKEITVNKFAISIYDGILHARRMRAFGEEIGNSKPNLSDFSQYFVAPKTDIAKLDFSTPEATTKTIADFAKVLLGTDGFLSGVKSFVCNSPLPSLSLPSIPIFGGTLSQDCGAEYGPPDLARMEEIALNAKPERDVLKFLGKRLNVLNAALINNGGISKTHPFYVEPTDSQFRANLKILGMLYSFWLDVVLLHKEPARGNPTVQTIARGMQEILKNSCAAQKYGAYHFPMLGNLKINGANRGYSQFLPIRLPNSANGQNAGRLDERKLLVVPMGVSNPDDYQPNPCLGVASQGSLGAPVPDPDPKNKGKFRPKDTVYGVYINDSALAPATAEQLNEDALAVDKKLVDFISSRVVMKFEGSEGDTFQLSSPSDSGTLLTFMGLPAFVLTASHGVPVNGVFLAEPPELIDPNPIGDSVGGVCD